MNELLKTEKERYAQLKKEIEYHNNLYYTMDAPELTDAEYDKLTQELKRLETAHPEWVASDSPTKKVGGKTKRELKKAKHDVLVASLQDVFSKEEVFNFVHKMQVECANPQFTVEQKIDGLSSELRYKSGDFKQGITRGDGTIGEDVTPNYLEIPSIPKTIAAKLPYLEARGEVYMTTEMFEKVNERQRENGAKEYQNARNLAAGTLRQLDSEIVRERHLDIFFFNLEKAEGMTFTTHTESLRWLASQGFPVIPDFEVCTTAEEVWDAICRIGEKRGDLAYGIDGAVVKVDNLADRERLGMTSKVPKWAVAYKYPPEEKETVVENIIVQVGRTGKLTPVAILKPVRLAGTTVSKATLNNQDWIDERDIRIGDTVLVRKAGDIIPEILDVNQNKRPSVSEPFKLPDTCPVCGAPTSREPHEADTKCANPSCPAQIVRSMMHFASRDAMNIEGLAESNIEALHEKGYLQSIADIYRLKNHTDALMALDRFGKKKVDNLLKAIEKSKEQPLPNLIHGLGIAHVGKRLSKTLINFFGDMEKLMNANHSQLQSIEGIGEVMAQEIRYYFQNPENLALIEELQSLGLTMKATQASGEGIFTGKTFVITGTLSKDRRDFEKLIESLGGKCTSSVSKNSQYLLMGDGVEGKSKHLKAMELGVPILRENDFNYLIS